MSQPCLFKRYKIGDYVLSLYGRLLVVYRVFDDMRPHVHGYAARPATKWERLKFWILGNGGACK